jgi:hypothetical protein
VSDWEQAKTIRIIPEHRLAGIPLPRRDRSRRSASAWAAHGDNAAILSATSSTSKCVLNALNDSFEPVRLGGFCFFSFSFASAGATPALTRLPFPPSSHVFPGSYPSFSFITDVIGCKSSTLSLTALIVVGVFRRRMLRFYFRANSDTQISPSEFARE